jgi:hypothetical protein
MFSKQIDEQLAATLRLATGNPSDPVSNNQTMDGSFSKKPFAVDLAYFSYHFLPELKVVGGKVNNPFKSAGKNELLFDGDLTPEGLYLSHDLNLRPFVINTTVANFQVEENATGKDSRLEAVQINLMHLYSRVHWTFGLGYFGFTNAKDQPTFVDSADSFGNSATVTTNSDGEVVATAYDDDFKLQQVYFTLRFMMSIPISIHTEYIKNLAVDEDNTGNHIALVFGEAKEEGTFHIGLANRIVEKDAVVGAFSDSNFGGGDTDAKGLEFFAKYALKKGRLFSVSAFNNTIPIEGGLSYKRYQADFIFKF